MLINKPEPETSKIWAIGDSISMITSLGLFVILTIGVFGTSWNSRSIMNAEIQSQPNVNIIGKHILTDMLLPFELLSILLLVALVGSITIAKRDDVIEKEILSESKPN